MVKRIVAFVVIGLLAGVVVGIVVSTVGSTGSTIHHAIATGRRLLHQNTRSGARAAVHAATTTHPARTTTTARTTPTTSTASTTSTTTTTTGTGTTARPVRLAAGPSYRCDQNINAHGRAAGGSAAACVVAENAFYEVYRGSGTSSRVPAQIKAWDPTAGAYVAMQCADRAGRITCVSSDGRASTFPLTAVHAYTPALAHRFTSGRALGPNG